MDPVTIYNIIKLVWAFIKKYWPHMTIGVLLLTIGGIILYYKIAVSNLNHTIDEMKIKEQALTQQVETLNGALDKEKKSFTEITKEYEACVVEKTTLNNSYTDLIKILKNKDKYSTSIGDAVAKEREKLVILKSECKKDGKDPIVNVYYECPKYTEIIKVRNKITNEFNGVSGSK